MNVKNYPDKKVIFTGRTSLFSETSQAQKAKFFLSSVRNEEILYESKSVNTFENAKFTYEKFKPGKDLYIIVTSEYHYKRSVEIFKRSAGMLNLFLKKTKITTFLNHVVDIVHFIIYINLLIILVILVMYLREYIALLYYRLKY